MKIPNDYRCFSNPFNRNEVTSGQKNAKICHLMVFDDGGDTSSY